MKTTEIQMEGVTSDSTLTYEENLALCFLTIDAEGSEEIVGVKYLGRQAIITFLRRKN